MNGGATLSGSAFQWQAEAYPASVPVRRGVAAPRVLALCLGLPLMAAAIAASCLLLNPVTLVQTRIVADGAGPAGRVALAEAAMRLAAMPGQTALLSGQEEALLITVTGEDAAATRQRARSVTDAVLDMPHAAGPQPAVGIATPPRQDGPDAAARAALAERSRLQATLDTTDARMAAVSASLTGIARDLAANAHATAERRPSRETLDRAAAALADLQLQRIQLQSRYQDSYPAVLALDGQIQSLRAHMQEEARRLDTAARVPDAADPALTGERDRLRGELSQLTDRRATAASALAIVTRTLASAAAERPDADPRPSPPAASVPPNPVLLEAATTVTAGPDYRWIVAPALLALGLALAMLPWLRPRRTQPVAAELLLQRMEALLLPALAGGPGRLHPALPYPATPAATPVGRVRHG